MCNCSIRVLHCRTNKDSVRLFDNYVLFRQREKASRRKKYSLAEAGSVAGLDTGKKQQQKYRLWVRCFNSCVVTDNNSLYFLNILL